MMLVLEGMSKRYGETVALDGIDVAMSRRSRPHRSWARTARARAPWSSSSPASSGPIGAHCGSTAAPVAPGAIPPTRGQHGIATVFQEVLLAPARTVLDNIFLGYDGLL